MRDSFVPFCFHSQSSSGMRVRVTASQNFNVEGADDQDNQGRVFIFPLSSLEKKVQRFMVPDLEEKVEVELVFCLEDGDGREVASSYPILLTESHNLRRNVRTQSKRRCVPELCAGQRAEQRAESLQAGPGEQGVDRI